jgi:hypothetical protein
MDGLAHEKVQGNYLPCGLAHLGAERVAVGSGVAARDRFDHCVITDRRHQPDKHLHLLAHLLDAAI